MIKLFDKLFSKSDEFQYLDPHNSASFVQVVKSGMFIQIDPRIIIANKFWDSWYIMKPEYKLFVKKMKQVYEDEPELFKKIFWIPICDPSVSYVDDKNTAKLAYDLDENPALGFTYKQSKLLAKNFSEDYLSHLGTKQQYLISVGVISFLMYEKGISEENILQVLCYNNIPDPFRLANNKMIKKTGVGVCDLLNTNKILDSTKSADGFYVTNKKVTELVYSDKTTVPWYSAVPFVVCDEMI